MLSAYNKLSNRRDSARRQSLRCLVHGHSRSLMLYQSKARLRLRIIITISVINTQLQHAFQLSRGSGQSSFRL